MSRHQWGGTSGPITTFIAGGLGLLTFIMLFFFVAFIGVLVICALCSVYLG